MQYIKNVRISFNRLFSSFLGFDSLMPLSAGFYAYRNFFLCKFMVHMINSLTTTDHCLNSYQNWLLFDVKDESIWND